MAVDLRISLQKLEVLLNVVRFGGVGRAAEAMYVAQPAVTGHIRSLEERLGARLFYREGHRLFLTPFGEAVYKWAEEVIRVTDEFDRELTDLSSGATGSAAVGAGISVGSYVLPSVLAGFRERNPGAGISLSVAKVDQVIDEVRRGGVDFAIVTTEAGLDLPGMVVEPIGSEEIVLVAAPEWSPCHGMVALADFATLPLVEMPEGLLRRNYVTGRLREAGVGEFNVVLELGHPEAAKRAVQDGIGLTLLARAAVEGELAAGTLVEVPIADLELNLPIALVYRQGKELAPLQQNLIAEIAAAFGQPRPAERPPLALVG
jgi:LysR family transcriptional regulator, low CO2-responsive transcriptional regulator